MRLEWSRFARADRDAIFSYIEADNPLAAATLDDRIRTRIEGLLQLPESGRPGRIKGTRELVITGTAYITAYVIMDDAIRILRVLHSAQLWPEELPDS